MEPSPVSEMRPEPPPGPSMSLGGRMANVLVTPGEVFDCVKASPSSVANWLVPAVILIVVSWLSAALIFSQAAVRQQIADLTEQSIQKQAKRMNLPPEKAEEMRQAAEKFGGIGQKAGAIVGPVVGAFASPFLWGLLLWLVGKYALKGNFPYLKAVETVGLTNVVAILETMVKTLLIILMGNMFASPR